MSGTQSSSVTPSPRRAGRCARHCCRASASSAAQQARPCCHPPPAAPAPCCHPERPGLPAAHQPARRMPPPLLPSHVPQQVRINAYRISLEDKGTATRNVVATIVHRKYDEYNGLMNDLSLMLLDRPVRGPVMKLPRREPQLPAAWPLRAWPLPAAARSSAAVRQRRAGAVPCQCLLRCGGCRPSPCLEACLRSLPQARQLNPATPCSPHSRHRRCHLPAELATGAPKEAAGGTDLRLIGFGVTGFKPFLNYHDPFGDGEQPVLGFKNVFAPVLQEVSGGFGGVLSWVGEHVLPPAGRPACQGVGAPNGTAINNAGPPLQLASCPLEVQHCLAL